MRNVKLFKPYVSLRSIINVIRVLLSDQLAEGPEVKKFEKEFGEKFGLRNVVALNSGTSALELAYELAEINEGDEVITPVLTCTATNIPFVRRKAAIIFADTDTDLNINIEDVKQKITAQTKAIVFVHFGGNNRGLQELLDICKEKNIVLIEDAAQAVGSDFWGKADFTCVSLQAIKTLTSGDGGFLICKNDDHYIKAKKLRWFGYDREEKQRLGDTDLDVAGYKYHMNDITAAIGRGNLDSVDKLIVHRKKLMTEYQHIGAIPSIWFSHILIDDRDNFIKYLKENGIGSGIYHYRNDKYTIFGGRKHFPVMDEIENKYMIFPMHQDVTVEDIQRIGSLMIAYAGNKGSLTRKDL